MKLVAHLERQQSSRTGATGARGFEHRRIAGNRTLDRFDAGLLRQLRLSHAQARPLALDFDQQRQQRAALSENGIDVLAEQFDLRVFLERFEGLAGPGHAARRFLNLDLDDVSSHHRFVLIQLPGEIDGNLGNGGRDLRG